MARDDETPWHRSLFVGVGALLGVAVLVGGLVSLVALGAVSVTGLGDEKETVQAKPSLHIPQNTSTADEDEDEEGLTLEDLNGGRTPTTSPGPEATSEPPKPAKKTQTTRAKPARSVISLSASPVEVARMERIYLSGTYPGGEGTSLQVQRFESGWTDFPTSTSVSGETFQTYVTTGQSGPNQFRVVDSSNGKKSNPVTVQVR